MERSEDMSVTKYIDFVHPNKQDLINKSSDNTSPDKSLETDEEGNGQKEEINKCYQWFARIDDEYIRPFLIYKYLIYVRPIYQQGLTIEAADIQNELKKAKIEEDQLIEDLTENFKTLKPKFKNNLDMDQSINDLLKQTSMRQ